MLPAALMTAGLLAFAAGGFSAAHASEYVNEKYGFAFEMPRSCEEMPAPIFENMLRTISTTKVPTLNQQYVTAIQCDNMPWFEYPYFIVEYRPGDFSRFINEPAPVQPKQKTVALQPPQANPFADNSAVVDMPAIAVDHERKIVFSTMNANPGGFAVKDMGAGFFRQDAMVFLHFYVPNRLVKHFTPLFDHAVASFRFVERPGAEMVETPSLPKPSLPAVKPKAVKVTPPPESPKTQPAVSPLREPVQKLPDVQPPKSQPEEQPPVLPKEAPAPVKAE